MKKIEDMLNSLKVPLIDDKYQFNALRSQLLQRFFSNQRQMVIRYRWAASLAAIMFVFFAISIIVPNFADNVNTFVFGEKQTDEPVLVENQLGTQGIVLKDEQGVALNSGNGIITNDKTYLIRQYQSSRTGKVMIVSEYDKQLQNSRIRQVSGSSY